MGTRRPPHPAKAYIIGLGDTLKAAAAKTGYNVDVVGRVLNRQATSWPEFRRRFAEAYGLPEDALFLDETGESTDVTAEKLAAVVGALRRGEEAAS